MWVAPADGALKCCRIALQSLLKLRVKQWGGNKAPANCWLRMVGQRILPFILGLDARVRSNIDDEFGVRIIRPENMAKIFRPSEHYVPTSFSALTWLSRVRLPGLFSYFVQFVCSQLNSKSKRWSWASRNKLEIRKLSTISLYYFTSMDYTLVHLTAQEATYFCF